MSDKDILSLICGILKNGTNQLIYKTEVESHRWKIILQRGTTRGERGKINCKIEFYICVCSVTQSRLTLCGSMAYSLPGSSVYWIFQARTLEQVAVSYSIGSSHPKDRTWVCCVSWIGRQILYHWCHMGSPLHIHTILYACVLSLFSHVHLFVTLRSITHQAPLYTGFSRQEHWSELLYPLSEDLPNAGIEPRSLMSLAVAWASLVAQRVKCLPTMRETWVWLLGQEDPLEKEMATHSSTLAWKIALTAKPHRLSWEAHTHTTIYKTSN